MGALVVVGMPIHDLISGLTSSSSSEDGLPRSSVGSAEQLAGGLTSTGRSVALTEVGLHTGSS